MKTQAHFSGIREIIIEQLDGAEKNVLVAVAWLTDRALFDSLVSCQRRGVAVFLAVLDDRINRQSSIAWERLTALGGQLHWLPEGTARAGSLHHKFCLIDNDTVINGSFNWTYRASSADENIIVIQGDAAFAEKFYHAFMHLLDKHGHDTVPLEIDRTKLLSRLTVIAKLLELEDFDELPAQASKLNHARSISEIADLISYLNQSDWAGARNQVNALLARGIAVTVYIDPMIEQYRWQVRLLGVQVMAMEAELADMQRQIHLFDYEQEQAIGELIRHYLDAKRRYLHQLHQKTGEDEARHEAEAADDTFRQYEEARAGRADEPEPVKLDPHQQAEIKQLYRKLAMQCHPDRVQEKDKERAKVLFQQMQAAYQNNDLTGLQELQRKIEQGLGPADDAVIPDQANHLRRRLTALQETLANLTQQLAAVSQSATWKTLSTQADWSAWFMQQAGQLKSEIERYHHILEKVQSQSEAVA